MESSLVRFGIPFIALALAALFVLAVRTAGGPLRTPPDGRGRRTALAALAMALWLTLVAALGLSGLLGRFDLRPPPMALWFGATLLLPVVLALSSLGQRLAHAVPLAALVGFQSFRLPLELLMHRAATDGLMPRVMSYPGYNFDIVTGTTARLPVIALARGQVPRGVVVAWNFMGLVLLAVIGGIAFAASPIFAAFGPENVNVWVTRFPYSWMS